MLSETIIQDNLLVNHIHLKNACIVCFPSSEVLNLILIFSRCLPQQACRSKGIGGWNH